MMSCNFLKIILNFITYIERSMTIFIIYIGIIRSLSCFDYTNFKFSLVIKIINFNLKNSNGPSSYAFHFPCECDYVSKFQFSTNLLHLCWKNSFLEMKILKLITWYPNMVQTIWNDMVQYTFNFHKYLKSFKLFLEYICVF
jgi:hypothetical protein